MCAECGHPTQRDTRARYCRPCAIKRHRVYHLRWWGGLTSAQRAAYHMRNKMRVMALPKKVREQRRARKIAYSRAHYVPYTTTRRCATMFCEGTFQLKGRGGHYRMFCDECRPIMREATRTAANRRYEAKLALRRRSGERR